MLNLKKVEQALFFLTLLLLPTQLGKHFWPEFSFIYSLKVDYLSPTLYFWDILVMGLLTVWILKRPKINWLAFNLLLLFSLTQAVSLTLADNVGAGLVRLEQYLVAGFFGVYVASQTENLKLKTKNFRYSVLSLKSYWPLTLAVFFESVLAILQFIKGGTIGLWILGERTFSLSTPGIAKFDFYGTEFLRPYATFPHPNVLAAFMVITLFILSFLRRQESNNKLFYGSLIRSGMTRVAMFLAGLTTLVTFSRAAILAGAATALVLFNRRGRIILVAILILLLPLLYTRYSSLLNFDNLTLLRREELSWSAFSIWQSSPVFGVGLNNFIPKAADDLLAGPSRFLQPVHNIFLLALSETGIIGLIGLISLIGYPIFKAFKHGNLLLIWVVVIFLGLFDHYFLTLPQGQRMLFLVWGISLSVLKFKDARSS